jgi:hypothetical protein
MFVIRVLAVAAVAATAAPRSGCDAIRGARVDVTRLRGGGHEQALLRCVVDGGRAPLVYAWKLSPGVRFGSYNAPQDEPTALVTVEAGKGAGVATCNATDAVGRTTSAQVALAPIAVTRPPTRDGSIVTVEGAGFGARGDGDALWLVPERGPAIACGFDCKQAAWSDAKIVACLPRLDGRAYDVRVESGGRLAVAPAPLPRAK